MRTILKLAVIAVLIPQLAFGATYYVDYGSGSDSNAGTSKGSPWKHAPGMLGLTPSNTSTGDGCTGTCASTTINAGDSIILKGGVVWPYTTLPWWFTSFSGSGSSSTFGCTGTGCIYIGYDPTWNAGLVNSVTLSRDLGGCNPGSPPSVAFSGGGGSSAAATALVIPSVAGTQEPNVAGSIYHVTVTNQGSGYTSNPAVSISGGGCYGVTAVADILRPIIDAGGSWNSSTLVASGPDWPVGTGAGNTIYGPGLTISGTNIIVDHLEIRNILQQARSAGTGIVTGIINLTNSGNSNITVENSYLHGRYTDCVLISCNAANEEGSDAGINTGGANPELVGNVLENGDAYFTGTSLTYCGVSFPCTFSEAGIHNTPGDLGSGEYKNNKIYSARWLIRAGANTSALPLIIDGNEAWLVLYDVSGEHVNEFYIQNTVGTMYEYNNVFHSAVSGASNQQQMGNGTTQYFFNNVNWLLGGGTSNWGIDGSFGAGAAGGHFYFFNNTMQGEASAPPASVPGTRNCIDVGGGPFNSALTVTYQNNHCITAANPWWNNQATGSTQNNSAGSTAVATIQASSTVQLNSTAIAQGYALSNVFAPTVSTNDTVTFSGAANTANLSSLCTSYLTPLCSDINGNARPATGGWQSGAYVLGGTPPPQPPQQPNPPSVLFPMIAGTATGDHTTCPPCPSAQACECYATDGNWKAANGSGYTLLAAQGPAGAQGPIGPAGPQGPKGATGPAGGVTSVNGKTGLVTIQATSVTTTTLK